MKAKNLLIKIGACSEAVYWAGDKDIDEAWQTCHRGDWMLWFYAKMRPHDIRALTLAKAYCANTVRHLLINLKSINAINMAIAYGRWEVDEIAVRSAFYDTYAAYSCYINFKDTNLNSYASMCAEYAAHSSADIDSIYVSESCHAAQYAADASSICAKSIDARKENLQLTADICRRYLSINWIRQ